MTEPAETRPQPACHGSTSNTVTGTADGTVVQARDIGSLTIHQLGDRWWRRRAVSVDDTLATLRAKVRDQWRDEVGHRGLHQPRPVRLRWRPSSRPVEVTSARRPLRGALNHDVTDVLPVARELVEAFHSDDRRQLVVLGAPGAGKTTLAILYTLAAAAYAGHPVPLLLSVAGWRPRNPDDSTGEPIETWVARRIADDHPELAGGADRLRRLWAAGQLLPVLDGLDELPEPMLARALADLDRSAGTGLGLVLTCRTTEYERAFAAGNALSHAAVVDIEPVTVEDAAVYLTQREPARSRRWDAVVDRMRREPGGPLATALSTPLMISLARQVYRDPAGDPAELTRFATADAARQHLLTRFLPSVYPDEHERERSTRWLAFLAHHLRDRVGDPNYEWWRLARSVPTAAIATTIMLFAGVLGAVFTPALAALLGSSQSFAGLLGPGLVIGLAVGAMVVPRSIRTARRQAASRRFLAAIGSGLVQDLGMLLTVTTTLSVTALAIGYQFARPATVAADFAVVDWAFSLSSGDYWAGLTLFAIFIVLAVVAAVNGLGALNGGLPQRSAPRVRLLAPSLAAGLGIGVVVALPFLAVLLVTPIDSQVAVGLWALVAGSVGVPLGLARWLAAPAERQESSSPQNLLRWDRRALFGTVAAAAFAGAATAALASLAFPASRQPPLLPISLIMGVVIGGVVLIGSGTAWLTYTVARAYLVLSGRLPWRLDRFLRRAHEVGVLRQTGPAYQLRHDLLTDHLADRWGPVADPTTTSRAARRRRGKRPGVVVLLTSTVLLAAAVPGIYLTNAPRLLDSPPESGRRFDGPPLSEGMVLSLDSRKLAAIATDTRAPAVRVWDVPSGRLEATVRLDFEVGSIAGLGLSANGTELTLATTADSFPAGENTCAVWRWRAGQVEPARPLPGATGECNHPTSVGLTFSPDGTAMAIGRNDGTVQLWDLTGDHAAGAPLGPYGPATSAVRNLAYSVDGHLLAILFDDGSVVVADVTTRAVVRTLPARTLDVDRSGRQLFAVGTAGRTVTTVDGDGVAALWELDNGGLWNTEGGGLVHRFATGRSAPESIALSSDGAELAVGQNDGTIELHDPTTGVTTGTLQPTAGGDPYYRRSPRGLAFAPDGKSLASASPDDGLVQVWSIPEM
ncbi:NACHT domain-containing protein [Amycolatopsis sp. NPDC004625]|uniref:NACHT and WD40 repeat domain-containing protein n=1 Tax=Amycolatopsis sp. NPDC004625 TaxID=3154670 RepID=UPI0033BBA4F9